MSETREVKAGKSAMIRVSEHGIGARCVLVDNETDHDVTVMVSTSTDIRTLQARIDQLTADKAELQAKVFAEQRHNGALIADADRREQRALALLPDCDAHRRELQYLRHCVSWYWESMNNSDSARMAIVQALGNTVLAIGRGAAGPEGTLKAADVVAWLEKAIDAQNKPLKRHGYPTLADCIRAGGCDHDGLSADVLADIAAALGLAVPAA